MMNKGSATLQQLYPFLLFLLMAVGIWAIRAPLHHMPLERDEGAYAVLARDWLSGAVPYRDRFDHKPPLIYVAYMPAVATTLDPVLAIRAWATIWLILTMGALAWAAWELWRMPGAALLAAGVLGVWGSSLAVQGPTFNSEMVMILPATLAFGAAARALGRHQTGWWLLAGAAGSLAVLSKPVALLLLPALLIGALLAPSLRQRMGSVLALLLGLALAGLPWLIYFWQVDALDAARLALWQYNLSYAQESIQRSSTALFQALWPIWRPLLPLGLAAVVGMLFPLWRWQRAHISALLWTIGLVGSAVISLRPYPHYYVAAMPALALWAGGLALFGQSVRRWWLRAALYGGLLIGLAAAPVASLRPLWDLTPEAQITALYPVDGAQQFSLSSKVAAWINNNTPPEGRLWVWASEPQLYYLSGRAVPTRYPYDYPLAVLPGARDEVIRTLDAAPPDVIVTYANVRPERFSGMQLTFGYIQRVRLGGFDIWTLPAKK